MNGYSTIYADGSSLNVSASEAAMLKTFGLITPHPDAGTNGILACDWMLDDSVEWEHVNEVLTPLPVERAHALYDRIGRALGWGDDQIKAATAAADKNAELRGGRPVE